jgi:hypothetical protein
MTHTPETLAALLAGTTEGRWEFVPAGNRPVIQRAGRFPHGFICTVESQNFVADARLIAAAPTLATELSAALVREAELREALGVALPLLQDHARWLRDLQAHATVIERTRCAIEQVSAALATKPEERG